MSVVAGVDGGNSKTLAVVCDLSGKIVGVGGAGCSNWEQVGREEAAQTLGEALEGALKAAGIGRDALVHLHIGLAGIDWPEDELVIGSALRECGWECRLVLENDSFLGIRACAPEGHGVRVNAGTGVCSGVLLPDGDKYAYGSYIDFGGRIGAEREVINEVIRSEDGRGRRTLLTDLLLKAVDQKTVPNALYAIHRLGHSIPNATLNHILFQAAGLGDVVAIDLVQRFARELALCATNLMRRFGLTDKAPVIVAFGSRFVRTGPLLFDTFSQEVHAAAPLANIMLADLPPAMGAVRAGLEACAADPVEAYAVAQASGRDGALCGEEVVPSNE